MHHSIKPMAAGVVLLAAMLLACGASAQTSVGLSPSLVWAAAPVASRPEASNAAPANRRR